jgi:thiamine-monophosphate kinase
MMKKLTELGEFGLIERIKRSVKYKGRDVIYGIGDDAAVLRYTKDKYLLFCSDMLIEDVHFRRNDATGFQIGRKALGVNLSDIAAMGGVPKYCVVSLGIPKGLSVRFLDGFYRGLNSMARQFSVSVVGGDTNRSDSFIVDVALIGETKRHSLVMRSGAKKGDVLFVSGSLGGSLRGRHLNFIPRVKESRILVKNFKVNSMIDISDGLSVDLSRILKESNTGAVIFEGLIPLSRNCISVKSALCDGEDFELLFSMTPKEADRLMKKRRRLFKTKISPIGKIVERSYGLNLIDNKGIMRGLKIEGYRHF